MDPELRQRAQATLERIGQRTARSYDPAAHLEEDEVFLLTVDQLPARRLRRRGSPRTAVVAAATDASDEQMEASELIDLLRAPGDLDPISPDDARGQTFLFYAAIFTRRDSSIALSSATTQGRCSKLRRPAAKLQHTGRLLGLFGDVVTHIEDPVLVFEPDFDLVVEADELAALKPNALSRLFADLEVAAAAVPTHLKELGRSGLNITPDVLEVIASACSKRRLLAGRLQNLIDANHLPTLTVDMVRAYVVGLNENPSRFIVGDQVVVSEDDVADLLDVLDQRHYRGGYDHLLRRADRNSVIP